LRGRQRGAERHVAGKAFSLADAIVAPSTTWKSGFYPGTSTVLLLSDWPNLCATIQANSEPRDARLVIVELAEVMAGTAAPIAGPGTFVLSGSLAQPKVMMAYYALRDPSCGFSDGSASSGSVTLTQASPTAPAGSLTLAFDDGGSLSGSFALTQPCDGARVDAYLNGTPSCN
jgi:hypothetical protein